VSVTVTRADARSLPLPDASVDLIVTSPPYFSLRSYTDGGEHYAGQIGSEATPREYVAALLECTREWVRVLKPSGSMFINLGDKYANTAPGQNIGKGSKTAYARDGYRSTTGMGVQTKSLMGLPWRYALACMDDLGLILRAEIIWAKPNGLPESVTDRVRRSHEQVFHFTRQPRYYSAVDEVREAYLAPNATRTFGNVDPSRGDHGKPHARLDARDVMNPLGKLPGSVWEIPSQPLTVPAALGTDHFAAFPMELPRRVIAGWSPPGICTACGEGRRPEVPRERYGTALRDAREAVGLSRQEVAAALGCHTRSLADWEDEGHLPSTDAWDALSNLLALGLSRSQFVATYDHVDTGTGDTDRRRRAEAAGAATYARKKNTIARQGTGYACACPQPDAPTRPATVADPFGGTGTTALVADALGRHGLSFDRSADYCRLARWRTTDPGERAKALQVPKPPPIMDGQDALFALETLDRP
jgi:DNA modification methylase/DNA-binding transcriptional regulator YiaG